MELLENLRGGFPRLGMLRLLEGLDELLYRGVHGGLRGRIGLQKRRGDRLLQLAKQLQGDRIVRFETRCQLIDQAGLALNQAILVTGQGFELGNDRAIGPKSAQISEIRPTSFGQQVGINTIGLGSRSASAQIDGIGID